MIDSCDGFTSLHLLIPSDTAMNNEKIRFTTELQDSPGQGGWNPCAFFPKAKPIRKARLPKVVTSSTLKAKWLRWFPSHLADASNKPLNLIP